MGSSQRQLVMMRYGFDIQSAQIQPDASMPEAKAEASRASGTPLVGDKGFAAMHSSQ
ncbi:MAG: hypothetical protein IPL15_06465 [Comamonadaceae bacterium]|uniref:hypothetical protein n=1 Tax=Candidatus Skiveiella danica TaxID=3386177 RepID=UPI0039090C65|nr:hypothetical protein [Comamonadaceae bacterium]